MIAYWRRIARLAEKNHCSMGVLEHDEHEDQLRDCISRGLKFSTTEVLRCYEEIAKWHRINRLIARFEDLSEAAPHIKSGYEYALRELYRKTYKTRVQLMAEARKLNVKNYGKLTKKELIFEIEKYQRDKIIRQKFERRR